MNPSVDRGHKWKPRIIKRYALFQIPALLILTFIYLLINQFYPISIYLFLVFMLLWIIKDMTLYPLTWRSYDVNPKTNGNPLYGKTGICLEDLNPQGRVKIRGEIWKARSRQNGRHVKKGKSIVVLDAEGLTLVVEESPES